MNKVFITNSANVLKIDLSKSSLAVNSRKAHLVTRTLKGKLSDNIIYIEGSTNFPIIINKFLDILKSLGIEDVKLHYDDSTKSDISEIERSREQFEEFSNKAKLIRNNKYIKDDFQNFQKSLDVFIRPLQYLQVLSAYHLSFAKNSCNFSVPGAGKTSSVIGAYNFLKIHGNVQKLLVVSPLSAFKAWKDEYFQCYGYEPEYVELFGQTKLTHQEIRNILYGQNSTIEMVLITYQSLESYSTLLVDFMSIHKTMLVLDEAHKIKRLSGGQWSKNALALAPYAKSRVVLTGTPAPNSYVDLINLYEFIWPNKNLLRFSSGQLRRMSRPNFSDTSQIKKLNDYASPFFIRVTKSDLKLPKPVMNKPTEIEMDLKHAEIYNSLERAFNLPAMVRGNLYNKSLVIAKMIRLRQAASDPELLTKAISDNYDTDEEVAPKYINDDIDVDIPVDIEKLIVDYSKDTVPNKYTQLIDKIQNIISSGGRVIVWCEFISTVDKLSRILDKNNIANKILYGAIDKDEREKIIDEFQDQEVSSFNVIIANPHAVGESISLHHYCHNAIYFEMSYNAATYMQSKDRIHRLGLPKDTVTTYDYFVSKDTIETDIVNKVLEKESNMLNLIEGEDIPLIKFNTDFLEDATDELKQMLRKYYERNNMV